MPPLRGAALPKVEADNEIQITRLQVYVQERQTVVEVFEKDTALRCSLTTGGFRIEWAREGAWRWCLGRSEENRSVAVPAHCSTGPREELCSESGWAGALPRQVDRNLRGQEIAKSAAGRAHWKPDDNQSLLGNT